MNQVAFFLVAEIFPVRNEKLKIPGVRLIDVGVVDFVDNAVAERKPDPAAGVISRTQSFFGAGGPVRLNSRRAESH